MPRVFISYSQKDAVAANLVYAWISAIGADVWYDQTSMTPGRLIVDSIMKGLSDSGVVIIVLSHSFITSEWATYELKTALAQSMKRSISLFILKIDDCSVPDYLQGYHYVDLQKGYQESGLSRVRAAIYEAAKEADTVKERMRIHAVLRRRLEAYERKREPAFDDHEYEDLLHFVDALPLNGAERAFLAILSAYKGLDLQKTTERAKDDEETIRALIEYVLGTAALRSHLRAGLLLERLNQTIVERAWKQAEAIDLEVRPDRKRFMRDFVLKGRTVDYAIELLQDEKADQLKVMEVIRQAAEQLKDPIALGFLSTRP